MEVKKRTLEEEQQKKINLENARNQLEIEKEMEIGKRLVNFLSNNTKFRK